MINTSGCMRRKCVFAKNQSETTENSRKSHNYKKNAGKSVICIDVNKFWICKYIILLLGRIFLLLNAF